MKLKSTELKNGILHSFPGIGDFTSQTIRAYNEAGWLYKMATTIAVHSQSSKLKFLKRFYPAIITKLKHRYFNILKPQQIITYPLREMWRLIAIRNFSMSYSDRVWEWAEKGYDKWVARQLNHNVKIVHAYEHAALSTFQKATKLGIVKVLEQTSQHYTFLNKIIELHLYLFPQLKSDHTDIIAGKLSIHRNKRKAEELELADIILCNSSFTRRTLTDGGIPENKILTIPLGFPPVADVRVEKPFLNKVIFLNAGSQSIRKGIHILCEAWKRCNFSADEASLLLIGSNMLSDEITKDLTGDVRRHDFIPKHELMQLMNEASVFVFPTLADGFGMVITESMSRGLPVIASENSAGPDLITDGYDGLLVKPGDINDLVAKMKWCVINKSQLPLMGSRAMDKAKTWQWEDYRKGLIEKLENKLASL